MARLFIGSIIAAALGFMWGFVSWTVLKLHDNDFGELKDPAVAAAIAQQASEDKVYIFPPKDLTIENEAERHEAHMTKMQDGPYVFAFARSEPGGMNMTSAMIWDFCTRLVGALLIGFLLLSAKNLRYLGRAFFVAFAGLFAAIICYTPLVAWFEFPSGFLLRMSLDIFVSWLLAGLVLAIFIRENKAP